MQEFTAVYLGVMIQKQFQFHYYDGCYHEELKG